MTDSAKKVCSGLRPWGREEAFHAETSPNLVDLKRSVIVFASAPRFEHDAASRTPPIACNSQNNRARWRRWEAIIGMRGNEKEEGGGGEGGVAYAMIAGERTWYSYWPEVEVCVQYTNRRVKKIDGRI